MFLLVYVIIFINKMHQVVVCKVIPVLRSSVCNVVFFILAKLNIKIKSNKIKMLSRKMHMRYVQFWSKCRGLLTSPQTSR